jgi:hypothetical protein
MARPTPRGSLAEFVTINFHNTKPNREFRNGFVPGTAPMGGRVREASSPDPSPLRPHRDRRLRAKTKRIEVANLLNFVISGMGLFLNSRKMNINEQNRSLSGPGSFGGMMRRGVGAAPSGLRAKMKSRNGPNIFQIEISGMGLFPHGGTLNGRGQNRTVPDPGSSGGTARPG